MIINQIANTEFRGYRSVCMFIQKCYSAGGVVQKLRALPRLDDAESKTPRLVLPFASCLYAFATCAACYSRYSGQLYDTDIVGVFMFWYWLTVTNHYSTARTVPATRMWNNEQDWYLNLYLYSVLHAFNILPVCKELFIHS